MAAGLVTREGDLLDHDGWPRPAPATPTSSSAPCGPWWPGSRLRTAPERPRTPATESWPAGSAAVDRWTSTPGPCRRSTSPDGGTSPCAERVAELTGLPTALDNDAKALALAEGWVGAARGRRNFLAMVVSTGVGGGIVLDGRLVHGASGNAGHVGHVIVEPEGRPCACGARGCLEAEASGTAIAAVTGRPAAEAPADVVDPVRTDGRSGRGLAGERARHRPDRRGRIGGARLRDPFFAAANDELRATRLSVLHPDGAPSSPPGWPTGVRWSGRAPSVGTAAGADVLGVPWREPGASRNVVATVVVRPWLWPVAAASRSCGWPGPGGGTGGHRCPARRALVALPDGDGLRRRRGRRHRTGRTSIVPPVEPGHAALAPPLTVPAPPRSADCRPSAGPRPGARRRGSRAPRSSLAVWGRESLVLRERVVRWY